MCEETICGICGRKINYFSCRRYQCIVTNFYYGKCSYCLLEETKSVKDSSYYKSGDYKTK